MSRIGKRPVVVPKGVTVNMTGAVLKAKGSKGELSFDIDQGRFPTVKVEQADGTVAVTRIEESRRAWCALLFRT